MVLNKVMEPESCVWALDSGFVYTMRNIQSAMGSTQGDLPLDSHRRMGLSLEKYSRVQDTKTNARGSPRDLRAAVLGDHVVTAQTVADLAVQLPAQEEQSQAYLLIIIISRLIFRQIYYLLKL